MAVMASKAPLEHSFAVAELLITRFRLSNDRHGTQKAIKYATQALTHCPPGNAKKRGGCQRAVGGALNAHFENIREATLSKYAIDALEEATTLIPRQDATLALAFNDLGNAYRHLHSFEDPGGNLAKSVRAYTSGVEVLREQLPRRPDAAAEMRMLYTGLGYTMLQRYMVLHLDDDLTSSWDYFHKAFEGISQDDPIFASRVSNYAFACGLRFAASGAWCYGRR
jgi:hypothetical protein